MPIEQDGVPFITQPPIKPHCHILPHAETDHGMFGMVTALIVQKPNA